MRFWVLVAIVFFPLSSFADKCGVQDLARLGNTAVDSDERGDAATCLIHNQLHDDAAMAQVLRILRDPNEQLFVREDIVSALGAAHWRKKVEIRGSLTPEHISRQEDDALNRTVASAKDILAVTQAVKHMQDTASTSRYEGEFVRVLSELILNKENHIQLRMACVEALTQITKIQLDSGLFDERNLRIAYEALKENSSTSDSASFYSGAGPALEALRSNARGELLATMDKPGRSLSSIGH